MKYNVSRNSLPFAYLLCLSQSSQTQTQPKGETAYGSKLKGTFSPSTIAKGIGEMAQNLSIPVGGA